MRQRRADARRNCASRRFTSPQRDRSMTGRRSSTTSSTRAAALVDSATCQLRSPPARARDPRADRRDLDTHRQAHQRIAIPRRARLIGGIVACVMIPGARSGFRHRPGSRRARTRRSAREISLPARSVLSLDRHHAAITATFDHHLAFRQRVLRNARAGRGSAPAPPLDVIPPKRQCERVVGMTLHAQRKRLHRRAARGSCRMVRRSRRQRSAGKRGCSRHADWRASVPTIATPPMTSECPFRVLGGRVHDRSKPNSKRPLHPRAGERVVPLPSGRAGAQLRRALSDRRS